MQMEGTEYTNACEWGAENILLLFYVKLHVIYWDQIQFYGGN